jgi:hypothetical protein
MPNLKIFAGITIGKLIIFELSNKKISTMEPTATEKKLKRKMIVLRVIGIILIAFQLLVYLGNINKPMPDREVSELPGYYIGYNLFLWIGIVMLIWSFNVGKKLKQVKKDEMMEGIGANDL